MVPTFHKVAFVVQTPFHYYLFSSIIDEVLKMGVECELVLNDFLQYERAWGAMYEALVSFISRVERDDIQAVPASLLIQHQLRYECVVSPFFSPLLPNISVKNVRVMYGLAKEPWNFAWWNVYYDKICCFGPYDYARLNIFDSCEQVGHVRFDPWFKGTLPSKEELLESLRLRRERETILYAPTYGDLCSIDDWLPQLAALQEQYNVIVKLHHGTAHLSSERHRREAVRSTFACVLDDSYDLLYALQAADYLVTDSSGVLFDGLLAGKTLVMLETDINSNLTHAESAEQLLRRDIVSVQRGQHLVEVLENVRTTHQNEATMHSLVRRFFAHTDGRASERAARVIVDLLQDDGTRPNVFLTSLRERCGQAESL